MNTIASRLQIGYVLLLLATSLYAYESLQGPTELLYWDKTNTYNGYTWFGAACIKFHEIGFGHAVNSFGIVAN